MLNCILESATVALTGACILMLISMARYEKKIANVLSHIEWLAIFFFAGLFILVGGLVRNRRNQIIKQKKY